MANKWLSAGFLFAALSIIIGAFAAHSLRSHHEDGKIDLQGLQNFETGARYQMYHAFALIVCGLLAKIYGDRKAVNISAVLFICGIFFFSGSLYLLSTRAILGIQSWTWLGPITPIGGACFIAGWITLAVCFLRQK